MKVFILFTAKCASLAVVGGQTSEMTTNLTVTTVTFTCSSGFTLNGVTQLTCDSAGAWSGPQPACCTLLCL